MQREALFPSEVPNWIDGRQCKPASGEVFTKLSPVNGNPLGRVARSRHVDVANAVDAAKRARGEWAAWTPVRRGDLLFDIARGMERRKEEIAAIVHLETGMSYKAALGETEGAIAQGRFMAGEGRRFYGRTTTSAVPDKYAMTIRQPIGVAGLIIAANTPIANAAWKVFPALICGNAAVMKAAEDTPATAWLFAGIAHEAGLPAGVLNVVQGYGEEAGAPLVEHPDVDVISFTGSTEVGRYVAQAAGKRLAKVSLELGGKNPLVVCDDADLRRAAEWVILSAFSNAGQRCAAGSRIIIFDAVYDRFRDMLVERTRKLKVGPRDEDDFGPVINESQLENMIRAVEKAKRDGAVILTGGDRMRDPNHKEGFFMAPTIIENVGPDDEISRTELFGPVTCLYRVRDFDEALETANRSPYGLTASIHTQNINRAVEFCRDVRSGVSIVNGGTYGSEPHMPFGGVKNSGNGFREPGTEALDVYSELKDIYILVNPSAR